MKRKSLISGFMFLFMFVSFVFIASAEETEKDKQKLPENVKAIIDKSCFACHNTDSRNEDAKEDLDFKTLGNLSLLKKIGAYKHIGEVVEEDKMPPKKFLENRPEKKLTEEEKNILIAWAKKEATDLVKSR